MASAKTVDLIADESKQADVGHGPKGSCSCSGGEAERVPHGFSVAEEKKKVEREGDAVSVARRLAAGPMVELRPLLPRSSDRRCVRQSVKRSSTVVRSNGDELSSVALGDALGRPRRCYPADESL
eukprot:gene13625-9758_t